MVFTSTWWASRFISFLIFSPHHTIINNNSSSSNNPFSPSLLCPRFHLVLLRFARFYVKRNPSAMQRNAPCVCVCVQMCCRGEEKDKEGSCNTIAKCLRYRIRSRRREQEKQDCAAGALFLLYDLGGDVSPKNLSELVSSSRTNKSLPLFPCCDFFPLFLFFSFLSSLVFLF